MAFQLVKLIGYTPSVIITGGLVPVGAFNVLTTYNEGDLVTYNNSSYVLYNDGSGYVAGTLPTDTSYWMGVGGVGESGYSGATGEGVLARGLYNPLTSYNINDLVSYINITWISLTNSNLGNTPEEGVNWSLFATQGVDGDSGYSGFSGQDGNNGDSGYSGFSGQDGIGDSGYSGFSGQNGSDGDSGYSGFSGQDGSDGDSGYSGQDGNNGDSGYSGMSGQNGSNGDSGYSGYSGIDGENGAPGDSGYSGYSGQDGSNGDSGYSGFSGISGQNGNDGDSGYSGYSGIDGTNGDSGYSGKSGFSGINGSNGDSGYSGYSGQDGVGDITFSKSFIITYPIAESDSPIWRAPAALTITAIHVLCIGGTNIIGQLWEYDGNGANGSSVDTANITGTAGSNVDDDGTLSNASIASGNYLGWKTTSVSGTVTQVIITFEYTLD